MKYPTFFLFSAFVGLVQAETVPGKGQNPPFVVTVSTTRDGGQGSLRAALQRANREAGTRIVFRMNARDAGFVAADGRWKIVPLSPLPALEKPDTRVEGDGSVVIVVTKRARRGWGYASGRRGVVSWE